MNDVSVVGPDGGEVIGLGPAQVRILEDGRTTGHRLGIGEITLAPAAPGRPSTGTRATMRASTWCPARPGSRSGTPCMTRRRARW